MRAVLPGALLSAGLLVATAAQAHNWGCWIQPNRTIYTYNTAVLNSQANAALNEWDSKTILALPRRSSHTEISVFDGYYGNTGWAGIASIESYSGCNILHGHARVNRSYSYTSNGYRGIFCQEVGHLFGLDHSNDGGCMGGGYYYSINTYYTVVQHNINDVYNKYVNRPALRAGDGAEIASATPASTPSSFLTGDMPEGSARAVAFWHDRPATLEEAVERSEAIVVANVLRVRPGPDLVVPVEGLEDGVDRIPTQRILMSVEQVLGGRMNARVFELFRTGSDTYTIAEDPAYAEGETYVLFLTARDRGTWRVIAPEGRLKVTEGGLESASWREFLSELGGRSVASVASEVAMLTPRGDGGAAPAPTVQFRRNAANPFGARTSVSFSLPAAGDVSLRVYDLQGRVVSTLMNGRVEGARWYTIEWDGTDQRRQPVGNGVFYLRLETPGETRTLSVVRAQ